MKITFFGAAQNVTGSKHLIETEGFRLLLDCGLHQGIREEANALNRKLPFDAKQVDAVILSHAHTDHSGALPILVKNGFTGPIYCTTATQDIAKYILADSAKVQEQDARYINQHLLRDEPPIVPLYTAEDAVAVFPLFKPTPYFRLSKTWTEINERIRFKFYDAGHILGSGIVYLEIKEGTETKTLVFSGDLGKGPVPILHDPEYVEENVDILLLECTYGNRIHAPITDAYALLKNLVTQAVKEKKKIIIPAFALGRTQEIIYTLHKMTDTGEIPRVPIYLDSPLAENISEVFSAHSEDFDMESFKDFGSKGDQPFVFSNLTYIESVEDSKHLNTLPGPFIIISASGMCEGGRVLHHLKNNIEDPNNIVLITGYQAEHTLGRKILEGVSPVRIHNTMCDVKAEIRVVNEFSAHADQPALLEFTKRTIGLKKLFLVHAETPQTEAFIPLVHAVLPEVEIHAPQLGESYIL